jgi:hypothetical protein
MGDPAIWIAGLAAAATLLSLLFGILRKPAFVPAHAVEDLREEVEDLRRRCADCREELARLRSALRDAIDRAEWWQEQYRKLKEKTDP